MAKNYEDMYRTLDDDYRNGRYYQAIKTFVNTYGQIAVKPKCDANGVEIKNLTGTDATAVYMSATLINAFYMRYSLDVRPTTDSEASQKQSFDSMRELTVTGKGTTPSRKSIENYYEGFMAYLIDNPDLEPEDVKEWRSEKTIKPFAEQCVAQLMKVGLRPQDILALFQLPLALNQAGVQITQVVNLLTRGTQVQTVQLPKQIAVGGFSEGAKEFMNYIKSKNSPVLKSIVMYYALDAIEQAGKTNPAKPIFSYEFASRRLTDTQIALLGQSGVSSIQFRAVFRDSMTYNDFERYQKWYKTFVDARDVKYKQGYLDFIQDMQNLST